MRTRAAARDPKRKLWKRVPVPNITETERTVELATAVTKAYPHVFRLSPLSPRGNEIARWCGARFGITGRQGRYKISTGRRWVRLNDSFFVRTAEDAVLFKLFWWNELDQD